MCIKKKGKKVFGMRVGFPWLKKGKKSFGGKKDVFVLGGKIPNQKIEKGPASVENRCLAPGSAQRPGKRRKKKNPSNFSQGSLTRDSHRGGRGGVNTYQEEEGLVKGCFQG